MFLGACRGRRSHPAVWRSRAGSADRGVGSGRRIRPGALPPELCEPPTGSAEAGGKPHHISWGPRFRRARAHPTMTFEKRLASMCAQVRRERPACRTNPLGFPLGGGRCEPRRMFRTFIAAPVPREGRLRPQPSAGEHLRAVALFLPLPRARSGRIRDVCAARLGRVACGLPRRMRPSPRCPRPRADLPRPTRRVSPTRTRRQR